jgi:hypothetical protein
MNDSLKEKGLGHSFVELHGMLSTGSSSVQIILKRMRILIERSSKNLEI